MCINLSILQFPINWQFCVQGAYERNRCPPKSRKVWFWKGVWGLRGVVFEELYWWCQVIKLFEGGQLGWVQGPTGSGAQLSSVQGLRCLELSAVTVWVKIEKWVCTSAGARLRKIIEEKQSYAMRIVRVTCNSPITLQVLLFIDTWSKEYTNKNNIIFHWVSVRTALGPSNVPPI